jgi:hypothetical protein
LQFAHPRGVDQQAALRQHDQFAVGRGVAAPAVLLPDFERALSLFAEQRVDQRALADARRAEERDRAASREIRVQRVEARAGARTDGVNRDASGNGGHLVEDDVEVVAHVGLVEHHHGQRPALTRRHDVALDPSQAVVAVEPRHQEHGVEVGGDHLFLGHVASRLPRELAAPGEDRVDRGAVAGGAALERNPVADGRVLTTGRRAVPQPAGYVRQRFVLPGADPVDVLVLQ